MQGVETMMYFSVALPQGYIFDSDWYGHPYTYRYKHRYMYILTYITLTIVSLQFNVV